MSNFRTLSFLVLLAVTLALSAENPELSLQGSGTANDPYLLTSGADIAELAKACAGEAGASSGVNAPHFEGVCFAVANDIDMSDIEGFYGIGSAPVGSSPAASWYFAGIIDGRNHTISNMKIDGIVCDDNGKALSAGKTGSRSYVGFIGTLKSPGAIGNLNFDSTCSVSGYTATGSIVGQAEAGAVISDCISAATVKNINKNSGGIVGYMKGSSSTPAMLTRCVFTGSVMENYEASGGIAGRCERAIILKCANLGDITCQSFNSARAEGKQNLGAGIAGYNYFGTVQDCINAGRIEVSYQKIGGIVAYNSNADCNVTSCVNLGQLICDDTQYFGAIVGHNFRSGSSPNFKYGGIKDCYYDSQLWGILEGKQIPEGAVTALSTADFTSGSALAGLDAESWKYEAGFYPRIDLALCADRIKEAAATYVLFPAGESAADFLTTATISTAMPGISAKMADGKWFRIDGSTITAVTPDEAVSDVIELTNGSYSLNIPVYNAPITFPGSGTAEDPYLITSAHDLQLMASVCNGPNTEHYAGVHFRLEADIDMADATGFVGIASKATRTYNSEVAYYFSGVFDGNGHTISRLTINGVLFGSDGVALDYTEGSTGNVGLFGALGKGAKVSGLTIKGANITGFYNVGAISGFIDNGATITDCRVTESTLTSYNKNVGGIAGATASTVDITNPPTISGCIVSGVVKANSEGAGGIVGDSRAIISSCVNLADVTVSMFNDCVVYPKYIRAGGITGNNCGDISMCLNLGNVTSSGSEVGGITGYNNNAYHMGNLISNINGGQVSATDVSDAGALIGTDYRVSLSTSSEQKIIANYYDNQYCNLLAAENMDKDGLSGANTVAIISETPLDGITEGWSFAAGRYPLPALLAEDPLALLAASTYITVESPHTLYNFGAEATLATTIPIEASLSGSDIFSISDGKILASDTDDFARTTLTLINGDYTRTLTLEKTGRVLPGKGTADEPYQIATADDFNTLATFILNNNVDFDGSYFVMTADIDFDGIDMPNPIGSTNTYFNGIFDGAGHVISNVNVNLIKNESNHVGGGLFGCLGQNGKISNLNVTSSSFSAAGTTGAIVGHCMGRVENCSIADNVTVYGEAVSDLTSEAGEEIGGAVGRMYPGAVLSNVTNKATVTGSRMVGGIVGASRDDGTSSVINCSNEGMITATADRQIVIQGGQQVANYVETMAGGIAGRFTGIIEGCTNRGEVSSSVCNAVGGILGKAFIDASVSNCKNYGNVHTANSYAGGIIGITSVTTGTDIHTKISNCENYGIVDGISSVGGIAGVAANGCSISNSANLGEVHPMLGRAGGIIGETSGTVAVDLSYNSAPITASMLAGGIAGDVPSGANLTITKCFNTGEITSGANGGASGIANSTTGTLSVTDCYNAGAISSARFAGGIAGRCDGATITRCYNAAEIKSTSDRNEYRVAVGNIVADASAKATVVDCCYPTEFSAAPADASYEGVRALSLDEMFKCNDILGDGFVYNNLMMPMLSGLENIDAAIAYSAWYLPDNNSDSDTDTFVLSDYEGVKWSAEGFLVIDGSNAVATGSGEATLTATYGGLSRKHTLTVSDTSAIDDLTTDETGCIIEWYGIDGTPLLSLDGVRIALQVTISPEGVRSAKVVRLNN